MPSHSDRTTSKLSSRKLLVPTMVRRSTSPSTFNTDQKVVGDAEWLGNDQLGGHRPTQINELLHNRYRIVHELGCGTYSTVWLAFDCKTGTHVAVKVGTADADKHEADVLSYLSSDVTPGTSTSEGSSLIPQALDRFRLTGFNGIHACLVTDPARCSLRDAREASGSGLFRLDAARSLAAQLALAVSFVHYHGYCHGDLHLGNLLLQWPSSTDTLTIDDLYARCGALDLKHPDEEEDTLSSCSTDASSQSVSPPWLGLESQDIELNEAKLLLSDFGTALRPSEESRFESYTPLSIRPPESQFESSTPLTFASDVWSLGCTIFELLAWKSLIYDNLFTSSDEITAQQVHLQGSMPEAWWDRWEARSEWFDEQKRPLTKESDLWSCERRVQEWMIEARQSYDMESPDEEEKAALLELLQAMLAWKPTERPSVQEVLGMPWMKKWALPAYEEARKAWT